MDENRSSQSRGDVEDGYSASLRLAVGYLGQRVTVAIDRPYGSHHPVHGFRYEANYGYITGTLAPDGEELDAYYLGPREPLEKAEGICIAVVHRLDDDDDKLIVVPDGSAPALTDDDILTAVAFQEVHGQHQLIREPLKRRRDCQYRPYIDDLPLPRSLRVGHSGQDSLSERVDEIFAEDFGR